MAKSARIDPSKFGGANRAKVLDQLRAARKRRLQVVDVLGENHRYRYYNSGLEETTKLFGGINPKDEILRYVARHGAVNVLEIGCGKAATLRGLENISGVRLFGTNAVIEPEFKGVKATIKICHAGQVARKFKDKMGFVFANSSLTHSAALLADLREVAKIMPPGGRLLVNFDENAARPDMAERLKNLGFRVIQRANAQVDATDPLFNDPIKVTLLTYYLEKFPQSPGRSPESLRGLSQLEKFRLRFGKGP